MDDFSISLKSKSWEQTIDSVRTAGKRIDSDEIGFAKVHLATAHTIERALNS
jgi:hypothetical protein